MDTIKSDFSGASQKATALKTATKELTQTSTITTDNQTTVSGNKNAQEVIQLAQTSAAAIANAVNQAATNLQSVASEFEAVDQQLSTSFSQPLGGLKQ